MVVQEKRMTVEEFWAEYANQPYELVEGRVIEVSPSGIRASEIAARIAGYMMMFVDSRRLGKVTSADAGFWLGPNTLRSPDAAFISVARLPQFKEREKYAPFAPDLAVEVVSPGDTAGEVLDKVALYLNAGTQLVWVIFPDQQAVVIHNPDATSRILRVGETLDGEDVLPGFRLAVADLFPPEPDAE